MECIKNHQPNKLGYAMLVVGGLIIIGIFHLGFLIPLAIATFLIYKGWQLIKPVKVDNENKETKIIQTSDPNPFTSTSSNDEDQ